MSSSGSGRVLPQWPAPRPNSSSSTSSNENFIVMIDRDNQEEDDATSSASQLHHDRIADGLSTFNSRKSGNDNQPSPLSLKSVGSFFQKAGQNIKSAHSNAQNLLEKSGATKVAIQTSKFITQTGENVVETVKETGTEILQGTNTAVNRVGEQLGGVGQKLADLTPPLLPNPIKQDIQDLTGKTMGFRDLCTRCSELPVSACWEDEARIPSEMLKWSTPLARVIYHAEWCRLCKLLLMMLYRPEHDPLKHPEVERYLQPELQNMTMKEWVDQGWAFTDKNWPFGRSETRQEGATLFLGPLGQGSKQILLTPEKRHAAVTLATSLVSAVAKKPRPKPPPFKGTYNDGLRRGLKKGREEATKYPLSCDIYISLFTSKSSEFPGLLMASCVGYGNRPGGEPKTLARFCMRVAHPNIRSNLGLEAPLSYGRLLDPDWIDLSVARWWIYECETKHGALCSQHGWDIALQKLESIRLIDVEKMCLVEHLDMTSACRYVALSYRWSKTKVVLKYENRIDFMEEGGLRKILDQIPRTIVDAMEVTMELGERYLWVDALVGIYFITSRIHYANLNSASSKRPGTTKRKLTYP